MRMADTLFLDFEGEGPKGPKGALGSPPGGSPIAPVWGDCLLPLWWPSIRGGMSIAGRTHEGLLP